MTVLSFKKSVEKLGETIAMDKALISGWAAGTDKWLERKGLSKRFRYAAYGIAAVGTAFSAATAPVQTLGALSLGFFQLAPFMRDNSNKRSNVFLGCALMAPHMALLNANIAALQVTIAGTRAYTMNIINDESYKTRIGLSAAFFAAGLGIALTFIPISSPLAALPLAAMACGTVADACPDRMTHIARILRIGGASLLMPYHAVLSQSIGGLANEAIGGINLARTAVQNDVPVRDETGASLTTTREKLQGWWKSILKMDRIPAERAGQEDPLNTLAKQIGKRNPLSRSPTL